MRFSFWKSSRREITKKRELSDIPKLPKPQVPQKLIKLVGTVVAVEKTLYQDSTYYHIWVKVKGKGKFIDSAGNMALQVSAGFASAPFVEKGDVVKFWYTDDKGFVDVARFGVKFHKRSAPQNPQDPQPNPASRQELHIIEPENRSEDVSAPEDEKTPQQHLKIVGMR